MQEQLKKIVILISSDKMGHGDDNLGEGLLINFLKTLDEMGPNLWRLILVNNGVKLVTTGSDAICPLQQLAEAGVRILACGTCLKHFNLQDRQEVGEPTNMVDIVTAMQLADSVINI